MEGRTSLQVTCRPCYVLVESPWENHSTSQNLYLSVKWAHQRILKDLDKIKEIKHRTWYKVDASPLPQTDPVTLMPTPARLSCPEPW